MWVRLRLCGSFGGELRPRVCGGRRAGRAPAKRPFTGCLAVLCPNQRGSAALATPRWSRPDRPPVQPAALEEKPTPHRPAAQPYKVAVVELRGCETGTEAGQNPSSTASAIAASSSGSVLGLFIAWSSCFGTASAGVARCNASREESRHSAAGYSKGTLPRRHRPGPAHDPGPASLRAGCATAQFSLTGCLAWASSLEPNSCGSSLQAAIRPTCRKLLILQSLRDG